MPPEIESITSTLNLKEKSTTLASTIYCLMYVCITLLLNQRLSRILLSLYILFFTIINPFKQCKNVKNGHMYFKGAFMLFFSYTLKALV